MHAFNIPDQLFQQVEQEAGAAGVSTETFLTTLISQAVRHDEDNYDHLFTPKVIAELRAISQEVKDGAKTYSLDEVKEHLAQHKKKWLESR